MEPGGVYAKNVQLDRELSQRLHGALTCGKEELFQVVADPAPEVIRAALRNPALDENHLLILLGRRDLVEDLVAAIGRHDAVAESHKLKAALVRNPATPAQLVMSLLPHLYLFELVDLCLLAGVTPDQRVAAERAVIQRLSTTPWVTRSPWPGAPPHRFWTPCSRRAMCGWWSRASRTPASRKGRSFNWFPAPVPPATSSLPWHATSAGATAPT